MMRLIQLQEQLTENTSLSSADSDALLPYVEEGGEVAFSVKRKGDETRCLTLHRCNDRISASGSYFVGIDWVREGEVAVQVNPKMNDGFEVDYVRMLNEALSEEENQEHLEDLVTVHFHKPMVSVSQQKDLLSIFLISEYLNVLQRVVRKGLRRDFYPVEENLGNKIKGRILVSRNIRMNQMKGDVTHTLCRYQVYDIDTPENRILKKAFRFSVKMLELYRKAMDVSVLDAKVLCIKPYLKGIGDEVSVKDIQTYRSNPVFKDHHRAMEYARLLLRRYSYDITVTGRKDIPTPPFWIDMSKLFELYVFHRLHKVFTAKHEIRYHVHANHQELDYLLDAKGWGQPYVIDAKYKPRYKTSVSIAMEDARQVSGYARLKSIYKRLNLKEDAPPVKCLIVYPDQDKEEFFEFTRDVEPPLDPIQDYIRIYKMGIRLPEIKNKTLF